MAEGTDVLPGHGHVASIGLAHQATLVTRNVKDFRQIPGLKVENGAA